MKKLFGYYFAGWALCFALFNIVVFAIPTTINGSTVIDVYRAVSIIINHASVTVSPKLSMLVSYLGTMDLDSVVFYKYGGAFLGCLVVIEMTFVLQLGCAYVALNTENRDKLFYNIPLIKISYSGLITTLIVGSLCMMTPNFPNWAGILICLLVLIPVIMSLIKAKAASDIIEKKDEKIRTNTAFMKLLTADAESLISKAKDDKAKNLCNKVYEAIRYSDPMSNASLANDEQNIVDAFKKFVSIIETGSDDMDIVANELLGLVEERNKKTKALK